MKRRPYFEMQQVNPFRKPAWRWLRANALVESGQYFSAKRDDAATGVAVAFLRDLARCRSDLRLGKVQQRFEHVDRAQQIGNTNDYRRLEIEARILAKQNDTEIALEMNLPPETIQAFADLFYDVRDKLEARSYITFQILRLDPRQTPRATTLMQASAYHHGPLVIGPWLAALRADSDAPDLTTRDGRMKATVDLFFATRTLPDNEETLRTLQKLVPVLIENRSNFIKSTSAARAFRESTSRIVAALNLPSTTLAPFSYSPVQYDLSWQPGPPAFAPYEDCRPA